MARADGVRAQTPVDLRLEGKKRDDAAGPAGDRAGATRAPGPDLRADVVDQGNPFPLKTARQETVEVGKVDEHRAIGTALPCGGLETPESPPQRGELFEDFGDPDDGEVLRGDHAVEAGGRQTPPAHA